MHKKTKTKQKLKKVQPCGSVSLSRESYDTHFELANTQSRGS